MVKTGAHPTQDRPGHRGAVDRVRSDQRVQRVEEDRGRRPGVHRRHRWRGRDRGDRAWRGVREVCQQVFEEAAVDLGKGLKSWSDSRSGKRKGKRVGLSPIQEENRCGAVVSAAQQAPQGPPAGDPDRRRQSPPLDHAARHRRRSAVHDDTRRLRRMLAKGRAKILFATVTHHGGRWWVSLNVEAADLHPSPPAPAPRRPKTVAGGSGSIGACRRSWSPPPPTAAKSPASPMRPKRWPPGCNAAAAGRR